MERKIDKDVAANIIMILFAAFCFFGCATKQKSLDISKSENHILSEIDSQHESGIMISSESHFKGFTALDFAEAMNKWKIGYEGSMGDNFRFWMNQTDSGFEAGAEGKGTANAEGEDKKIITEFETSWQKRFDSLSRAYENQLISIDARIKEYEKNKSIEKRSVGLQAGAYIVGVVVLLLLSLLLWLGWKVRKLGKSVQAFMNSKNL